MTLNSYTYLVKTKLAKKVSLSLKPIYFSNFLINNEI